MILLLHLTILRLVAVCVRMCVCVCVFIYVCVCVCVCKGEREREKERDGGVGMVVFHSIVIFPTNAHRRLSQSPLFAIFLNIFIPHTHTHTLSLSLFLLHTPTYTHTNIHPPTHSALASFITKKPTIWIILNWPKYDALSLRNNFLIQRK